MLTSPHLRTNTHLHTQTCTPVHPRARTHAGEPHIAASHRRKLADHKDLLSDIKGTFRDVGDSLSDAFNEVEEFVKGVGRGARREVLQVRRRDCGVSGFAPMFECEGLKGCLCTAFVCACMHALLHAVVECPAGLAMVRPHVETLQP